MGKKSLRFFYAIAVAILIFSTIGCDCNKNPSQATPEKTIDTYLKQSSLLRSLPDPLAYNGALECFSEKEVDWWNANVENLAGDLDDLAGLPRSQKEAMIFSMKVVSKGLRTQNSPTTIKKISQTKKKAKYLVNGIEVSLVNEDGNWKFESLFGVHSE